MLKKVGIGVIVLIVIVVLGSLADGGSDSQPAESPAAAASSAPSEAPSQPPAPDWAAGVPLTPESVRAALGDAETISRAEKLGSAKDVTADDASGTIVLTYKPESVWDNADVLTITSRTAYSAARALFANPRVQAVSVVVLGDWTDQYGKTSEARSADLLLTRATADKVDWDGLKSQVIGDNKHLFCLADKRFIHPAIFLDLKDAGCLRG